MLNRNFNPHHLDKKVQKPHQTLGLKKIIVFIKKLWPYLRPQKTTFIIIIIAIFLSIFFQLLGPLIVSLIINQYIVTKQLASINLMILFLILIYLLSSLFQWLQDFLLARIIPDIIARIRHDAYQKLQSLPISFYDQKPFGEVMSLLTNDLDNLDNALISTTTQIISSILSVFGALIFMFYQNFYLALITFITVPLTIFLSQIIARKARKFFTEQQQKMAQINSYAEENLNATLLIKSYGKEAVTIEKFNHLVDHYYNSNFKANFFSSLMMMSMLIINNLNLVLLALVGGHLLFAHLLQVGVFASFLQYQRQFTRPLGTLANQFMTLQLALISGERVMKIFDYQSEANPDRPINNINLTQLLKFNQLNFAYQSSTPILKNINFEAKTGQTIALVGPTGSGKTTLANLILRFYDPSSGHISFDHTDISLASRPQIRNLIGVVLQDIHLFSGTITDNICLGKPNATQEEIILAAKKAHAHDFITKLPHGYQTQINANSITLSQGQKQLLAIARVFLINPPMIILDEATSNIDTLTEYDVQKAMNKLLKNRLSLVIAHRLSTVKNADHILVMKEGTIIEQGDHHTLLQQNGFYAQIYHSQDADLLTT